MEKTKFDLTRAMVGEKVVTRDGQCPIYNGKTGNPLFTHAWILTNGTSFTTTDDGDWGNSTNHPLDLFMASEPKDKTDSTDDEVAKQHLLNIWPSVATEAEEKKRVFNFFPNEKSDYTLTLYDEPFAICETAGQAMRLTNYINSLTMRISTLEAMLRDSIPKPLNPLDILRESDHRVASEVEEKSATDSGSR